MVVNASLSSNLSRVSRSTTAYNLTPFVLKSNYMFVFVFAFPLFILTKSLPPSPSLIKNIIFSNLMNTYVITAHCHVFPSFID